MKNIIINIILTIILIPVVATGASLGSSLIAGKTIDEAVQILADQVVILTGRVDTLEAAQNSLIVQQASTTATQKVDRFDIDVIKEQNALLKAQNETLTTKSADLETKVKVADTELQNVKQTQQTQQAIISPPPVMSVSISASGWGYDSNIPHDRIWRGDSIPLRLIGVNVKTDDSNVDISVRSITVRLIGDYNPSMFTALRIEKNGAIVGYISGDNRWGNDVTVTGGDIVLPVNISIKADSRASFLVYGLIDPKGKYEDVRYVKMQAVSIDMDGLSNSDISYITGPTYIINNI